MTRMAAGGSPPQSRARIAVQLQAMQLPMADSVTHGLSIITSYYRLTS